MAGINCPLFIQSLPNIPIYDEITSSDSSLYYSYVFREILEYKKMSYSSASSSAMSAGIPLKSIMIGFGYADSNAGWSKFVSDIQDTTKVETLIKRVSRTLSRTINDTISDAIRTCMINDNQSMPGISVVPIPSAVAPLTFKITLDYSIYIGSPKYLDIEFQSAPAPVSWGEVNANGELIFSHKHSIRLYALDTVVLTKKIENIHDNLSITVRVTTPIPGALQRIPTDIIFPGVPKKAPKRVNQVYVLTTTTANGKKSDTDDVFFCQIKGSKGTSAFIKLNNKGNDRERNDVDKYILDTKKEIGVVESITFKGRRNKKAKQVDDWTLKKFTLTDMTTGKVYRHNKPVAVGDGNPKNPKNSRKVLTIPL